MKYYTICIYVDLNTGEQLTKERVIEKYIIKNKKTSYKHDEQNQITTKTICYECTESTQLKLL